MTTSDVTRELYPAAEPDTAVPPGETLRELLDDLEMTQAELARRTGLSAKHVNRLVQGLVPLTAEVADQLALVTGMPARLWNRLEADYRTTQQTLRLRRDPVAAWDWASALPLKALVERGFLPQKPEDQLSRVDQALAFFGVASVEAWQEVCLTPQVAFRQTKAYTVDDAAVATWLRLGEVAARDLTVAPYDENNLRDVLPELRSLTTAPPEKSIQGVVELCRNAGVAVVFVAEIPGARASGATRWLTPDKALVQLSLRYKSDDHLWFTIFHELAHVLLHGKRDLHVESGKIGESNDPLEQQADRFASNLLIPPAQAQRLRQLRSLASIETFAREIGVSPGIVVGRMQHDKIWPFNRGNGLKKRLQLKETVAAGAA
ncbi:ImmA/IrrE family metallo-endopeptidase [Kitasatospora sp. NBC_01250]|uniref:ImmA/IrrE family metallo-endopeptidase n=1 Tax=Kitasatospora sp. NBC_01250 TaxID=2903571 RepID=UPI002E3125CD|nr:ImmA/IrrE family metallo-endopeptidase [Kitasatospora sp. NBC_01250]